MTMPLVVPVGLGVNDCAMTNAVRCFAVITRSVWITDVIQMPSQIFQCSRRRRHWCRVNVALRQRPRDRPTWLLAASYRL